MVSRYSNPLVVLAILVLIGTAGCDHQAAALPTTPDRARVATITPSYKTLRYTIEEPGQVEGFEEAPLYAKLAAYVEKVNVDIGSRVKEHDVLAELRIPELQREFEQKVAAVKQAQAALAQAQAAVAVARAAVTSAKAKLVGAQAAIQRTEADYQRWRSESARMNELADKGTVTRKAADESQDQFRSADAARSESVAGVDSAKAVIAESEAKELAAIADESGAAAKVLVAEADQAHTKALLDYTEIRAPFTGTITRRNVHPGHFVQPAEANGGKPLFTIARTDLLRAIFYVPEADAPYVSVDDRAEIRVPALGNKTFSARVQRTSIALDNATRTLRIEMDLKYDEHAWRPGSYAYADLTIERPHVLTVPATAVFVEAGQSICAAVVDGKIDRKPVEVGIHSGADVQIVAGLKEEDQVVVMDAASLRTGQVVTVGAPPLAPKAADGK